MLGRVGCDRGTGSKERAGRVGCDRGTGSKERLPIVCICRMLRGLVEACAAGALRCPGKRVLQRRRASPAFPDREAPALQKCPHARSAPDNPHAPRPRARPPRRAGGRRSDRPRSAPICAHPRFPDSSSVRSMKSGTVDSLMLRAFGGRWCLVALAAIEGQVQRSVLVASAAIGGQVQRSASL